MAVGVKGQLKDLKLTGWVEPTFISFISISPISNEQIIRDGVVKLLNLIQEINTIDHSTAFAKVSY